MAGQLIDQQLGYAECLGDGFGTLINPEAKRFFSIYVQEVNLPEDLSAIGSLADNGNFPFEKAKYTFYILVDSSRKYKNVINELKTIFQKMVLSHETCHFVFYYELFFSLGNYSIEKLYKMFHDALTEKLDSSITNTAQPVTGVHKYKEFLKNFWYYTDSHYDKNKPPLHDYEESNIKFFGYLTEK